MITSDYKLSTESIFDSVLSSNMFRLDGGAISLPKTVISLCEAIKGEGETNWSLGEYSDCTLSDFIVGAYWSFAEWHAGQNSIEYAALCALGSIFSPGMTSPPDEDEPEFAAYDACNKWFMGALNPPIL